MDGQTVKVGESFNLGNGVKAKNPGNSGVASHDCNCRCFLEYDLMTAEEFAKATGRSIDKKVVDNYKKSGIIEENIKKSITKITDATIEKVPNVKIDGYSSKQCEFIQQQHKELLKYSRDNNDNKEIAFVFDNKLDNRKEYKGSDDSIDFGGALYGKDLFIIHNHPRNSSYLATDIIFMLQHDSVKTLSIVKNSASVEVLTKSSNFNSSEIQKDFRRIIKKSVKTENSSEYAKAVKKLIEKHNKDGGMLKWTK